MTPCYYSALPSYFGGKRKLLPYIAKALSNVIPREQWQELSFLDAFAGGGSVSLWAKLAGFAQLFSNDVSQRSAIVMQGLIANDHTRLRLETFQPLTSLEERTHPGFVEETYAGSVFSTRHARMLDRLLELIHQTQCPITQQLQRLVLWKLVERYVAYGTSIGTSNRGCAEALDSGNYHELNPNRLNDGSLERLLKPSLVVLESLVNQINHGVFPALGKVYDCQEDVFTLVNAIPVVDVAYFDPPYANTVGYGEELSVLDSVLFGGEVATPNSVFTGDVQSLRTLFDCYLDVPVWVLSYNDKVMGLNELMTLVKGVDPDRTVTGQAIEYAHMAHVAKRTNHELLITAHKGVS